MSSVPLASDQRDNTDESQWVTPIDQLKQEEVVAEVHRLLRFAESHYQQSFENIDVLFNLKGRAAGMYKVKQQRVKGSFFSRSEIHRYACLRFNPWLFAKYPEDSWHNTIPHEVAHYLADCLYGLKSIRPHGKEWQSIMADLGAEPIVRANYDMSNIPVRKTQSFLYRCQCREVSLSAYRHHKITNGLQRYLCRDCKTELTAL